MSDYQIIIERKNAFYGCALKHSVELDGFSVGTLKNGQSLTVSTTVGQHTLSFIAHGKVEKCITLQIEPKDYKTKILAEINGRQKLEIIKDASTSTINQNAYIEQPVEKKKKHTVLQIIAVVFVIFGILWIVGSRGSAPSSDQLLENPEPAELTDEEQAEAQLEKASEKFQSGDYMDAIEICDQIVSDYPDTETAIGIHSYLEEQFAQYPRYSAEDLMSEYDANIVNADEVYTDTVMVVTGTVSSIGKTNNDTNLTVMLESGTYFYGVQLNFKTSQTESIAALSVGDSVTVVGKCTGQSGKQLVIFDGNNVMIENCYLLDE